MKKQEFEDEDGSFEDPKNQSKLKIQMANTNYEGFGGAGGA